MTTLTIFLILLDCFFVAVLFKIEQDKPSHTFSQRASTVLVVFVMAANAVALLWSLVKR